METTRTFEHERAEIGAAVVRERELNEALSYLDRAISRIAHQNTPSRWSSAHCPPQARAFSMPALEPVFRLCAAAFGIEHHSAGEMRP
jgi:hypothetical protein